jgi:hypothetical protein
LLERRGFGTLFKMLTNFRQALAGVFGKGSEVTVQEVPHYVSQRRRFHILQDRLQNCL